MSCFVEQISRHLVLRIHKVIRFDTEGNSEIESKRTNEAHAIREAKRNSFRKFCEGIEQISETSKLNSVWYSNNTDATDAEIKKDGKRGIVES